MLNVEKAFKLKKSDDLLEAAKEAEHSNCTQDVIRGLYKLYYEAVKKEERRHSSAK